MCVQPQREHADRARSREQPSAGRQRIVNGLRPHGVVDPDGRWYAVGGDEGTVLIKDIATGATRSKIAALTSTRWPRWHALQVGPGSRQAAPPTGSCSGQASQPKGHYASGTAQPARWSPISPRRGSCSPAVTALAIAPDGAWLAGSGTDGAVQIWDTATWTCQGIPGRSAEVYALAIAHDSNLIAAGDAEGAIKIWDRASGRCIAELPGPRLGRFDAVGALTFAPDSSWLASGDSDGIVRIGTPAPSSNEPS